MDVLMVGVGPKRVGGMWTVAEQYINSKKYNEKVNLWYIATSTNGSLLTRFLYMIYGYIKILLIFFTVHVDIVHIHMAERGSTFRKGIVAKWGNKKGVKIIIHLHAGPFMAWYTTLSHANQSRVREIFGYANKVFVLGEYWKHELAEIIPENKMLVLYNGVDCPASNQYSADAKYIVYFGVMKKEKGIYDLIEAIKLIDDQLPEDVKVYLCGTDLVGDIHEFICKLGLNHRIELPGWVSGENKEAIYQNAMLSVLPSYYEGLSISVLESMARGIPIIVTNISTMPELVEPECMVSPGDKRSLSEKIIKLVLSKESRKIISQNEYRKAIEIFSIDNFINKTISIYQSLLSNNEQNR